MTNQSQGEPQLKNCLNLTGLWTICLWVIFSMTTTMRETSALKAVPPPLEGAHLYPQHRGKLNTSGLAWYSSCYMYGPWCAKWVLKAMLELLNDGSKLLQTLDSHPRENQPSHLSATGADELFVNLGASGTLSFTWVCLGN